MNLQKTKVYRNKNYLAWVKVQPCCSCGGVADDAHHLIGVGHLGGMGTKAPDWAVMPVCRRCHGLFHESKITWDDQWEYIARTLGMAIDNGFFKVEK